MSAGHPDLTERQWRILEQLADGQSATAIARALGVQVSDVRGQLVAIYRLLPLAGAADRPAAAVAWYREHGALVAPSPTVVAPIPAETPAASGSDLKPAQWLVLARLARGESNATIALALGIPPGTVEKRVSAIYRRLALPDGSRKRAAAADWYQREGRRYREGAGGDA